MKGGKLEAVLSRLEKGWAAVPDLLKETGWGPTTLRGAISAAAKKRGLKIERIRESGITSYRIAPAEYQPRDDFAKSVDAAYGAVKERVAQGGPPWKPSDVND